MDKAPLEALIGALDNWAAIFTLLVVVGVGGELVIHILQSRANKKLIALQHSESLAQEAQIARLRKDSAAFEFAVASANKGSAEALERAAKAEENLGNARRDAALANEQAALAEQHAAEANRIAEQERLARTKLEATLSGWRLDTQAQNRIIEKLKPYPGTPFDFATNPTEYRFLDTMDQIFKSAQWSRQLPKANNALFNLLVDGKASITFLSGITVEFAQERLKDFGPAAEALVKALIAEGIPAKAHLVTQGSEPNAIHVVIGKRE